MYVISKDKKIHPAGTITLELKGQLYAGLVLTSHDSTNVETALFSDVYQKNLGTAAADKRIVESTLEVMNIETGVRTIVRRSKEHFEAPNWSRDGKYFVYNSGGKIYTLPVKGGTPKLMNTAFADKCNNDHGISPDGKNFVISHHGGPDNRSLIYSLPIKGGTPKQITQNGPSYWHGWSPDGKTLAYCAERNGEYDVYTIPVTGGEETRLTTAIGLDDGPDYSPDGQYIYFNSVRTKQMKIWRMKADGSEQTQITPDDEYRDWFAHPSPDNKWLVFVSFDKSVEGHPANKNVVLRMMPVNSKEIKVVAKLFGGQGTINVPSWSPDSKKFAFVSYHLVKP
jgi:Tol biopolymer transport system component